SAHLLVTVLLIAEFLAPVKRWFDVLLPRLKEHLYHKGGPVIMIQIENDYGSYAACDTDYIGALNALVREHLGPEVLVSTVDIGTKNHLKCGSPFKLNLATINFGPSGDTVGLFNRNLELHAFTDNCHYSISQVNSEYYTGWMDHWGYPHFQIEPKVFIDRLLDLLYYSPRISFKNTSGVEVPRNTTKIAYDAIPVYLVSHLIEHVTGGSSAMVTVSMEAVQQYSGFMLYRTEFYRDAGQPVRLKFKDVADYAYIYTTSVNLDTLVFHGAISRNDRSLVFYFKPKFNTTDLLILVENAGYTTYNSKFYNDHKGIIGPVSADGRELLGWSFMPVCLNAESHSKCNWTLVDKITEKFISDVQKTSEQQIGGKRSWPTSGSIFAGILNIESFERLADTFVQPLNFTRGVLLVNNEVVGKYNQALGPQLRVYVPKNFLHVGTNIFILIELDSLWLNETMTSVNRSVGISYPLLFDVQMQWHRTRDRSLQ
ncbi:glycosyl hydrolase family 35, partial [Opisthorchis viverrini]